jgi:hypothetical protein
MWKPKWTQHVSLFMLCVIAIFIMRELFSPLREGVKNKKGKKGKKKGVAKPKKAKKAKGPKKIKKKKKKSKGVPAACSNAATAASKNRFDKAASDPAGLQQELLGGPYSYSDQIKGPAEIGMSSKGTLKALAKDIQGIQKYIQLLVTGKSKASKTGGPLGDKYFLKTGGKCMDPVTKQKQDRYIYINNVPQGNIPLISSAAGMNFSDFRGLIPGMVSNMGAINPVAILGAFRAGSTPECQKVTLQTINNQNQKSTETHYVTTVDLQNMDPCTFRNKVNPVTKIKCRQGFTSMQPYGYLLHEEEDNDTRSQSSDSSDSDSDEEEEEEEEEQAGDYLASLSEDPMVKAYFTSLGFLGILIVYRLMTKNK